MKLALLERALSAPIIILILLWQKGISPYIGQHCRFEPSCSEYSKQSLNRHGVLRGLFLAGKRILKCHPRHPGGIDPVPD